MGIDGDMLEKASGRIDRRQLGTGAQPRVDSQDPAAAGGCREQQVAQVLGKDPDCLLIGGLFRLQPDIQFNRWGEQALVGIGDDLPQEPGETAFGRHEQRTQAAEDLLLRGFDAQPQNVLLLTPPHRQHAV